MFTGLVGAVGTVTSVDAGAEVKRIRITAPANWSEPEIGASVCCSGICLTVTESRRDGDNVVFAVDVGPETARLTTAAKWQAGTRINLERSLRMGDEVGGHWVSGHVDGLAKITDRQVEGDTVVFDFVAPANLSRLIAVKGSVALDGTSLTVNDVDGAAFDCQLIPHTLAVTTWAERRPGDSVNLEVDLIARYVDRLLPRQ